MTTNYYDEAEIRKTISLMKYEGELFEIRILKNDGNILSGYFNDVDIFISELKKQKLKGTNVYITLNEPNKACFSREQKNCFREVKKSIQKTNVSNFTPNSHGSTVLFLIQTTTTAFFSETAN